MDTTGKQYTHGSLFAGIGGFDLGFERAGFKTVWQVEIDPFCRRVLERHFPEARRYDDIRTCCGEFRPENGKSSNCLRSSHIHLPWVDVISAGVPCQDVSIAGKRLGLAGKRTRLVYQFARILSDLRPTWFVFENVPGLLSSNEGRDFAEILRLFMVKCGYGVAWRVLDSKFFGVPQRRERVFLVGRLGRPCPAEILFESEGLSGSTTESQQSRADIAAPLTSGIGLCGKPAGRRMEDDYNLAVSRALANASVSSGYRYDPNGEELIVGALQSHSREHGHAMSTQQAAESNQFIAYCLREDPGGIGQGHNTNFVVSSAPNTNRVRSFAGLPKGMDSPRYRSLGNAVTRNVPEWIAKRIKAVLDCH